MLYENELVSITYSIRNQVSGLECYSFFEDKATIRDYVVNITDNITDSIEMLQKHLVIVTCKRLLLDLEYLKEVEKANDCSEYEEELYVCKETVKFLLNLMNSYSLHEYSCAKDINPLKELKIMVSFDTSIPTINFLVETLLESLRIINDSVTEELILQKLLFIEHSNNRFLDEYIFNVTKKVTSIMKKKSTETKVKEK